MERRSFFWFSARWLHYKVWPGWIWFALKALLALGIAFVTAWSAAFLYFYFFPPATLYTVRKEAQSRLDSLKLFQQKYAALIQQKAHIDSLEARLYQELTQMPARRADTTTLSPPYTSLEVMREETLAQYVERVRALLARQIQQEALLQQLAARLACLPRYRPIQKGEVAVGFGSVYHPITLLPYDHKGIDFIATPGTPVLTTADGIVREVSPLPYSENSYKVVIEHTPALHTVYYPLEPTVHPGQLLTRGTRIGYVTRFSMARTSFLHYEVWRQGQPGDPLPYLWGDMETQEIEALQQAFQSPVYGLH